MQKTIVHGALALGVAALLGLDVAAAERFQTRCVATAGLDKHEAATTTAGTERTGSYDVTLSSSGDIAELKVDPKKAVEAGDATKVAAPIDKVFLRSPYKSEATALPTGESGASANGTYVARFDVAAIRALPNGDVDVVVLTSDGERLCRVKSRDRAKLVAGR